MNKQPLPCYSTNPALISNYLSAWNVEIKTLQSKKSMLISLETATINSVSYARPFKINANTLEPFIIEFSGNGSACLKDFCSSRNQHLQRFIQFSGEKFESYDDICKKYKSISPEYAKQVSELAAYFFWEPGAYTIAIDVLHDLGKKTCSKFTFCLEENESELLRKNIDSTIFCRLYENTPTPAFFNVINKPLS